MKKFILATLAASLVATPVLAAPRDHDRGHDRTRIERTVVKQKTVVRHDDRGRYASQHRWNRGERFDSRYARNYRVVYNPRAYRLQEAPRGYRWVNSGGDAVLVGITSGIVAAVLANALN
jgi:Ni/Co efflux regulator RcnB